MHLGWHLAAGVALGIVIGGEGVPIMMGMVGIDLIDHGIWGLMRIRPLKIKNIWKTTNYLYRKMEAQLYFFHTVEIYLLIMGLSQHFKWSSWFMLAYSIHLLMDIFWYLRKRRKLDWVKKWSLSWWIFKKHLTDFELVYKR
ncbi:MAG: hypothetical protein WC503_04370 [Candidatus Shapirobacteria bacterium]